MKLTAKEIEVATMQNELDDAMWTKTPHWRCPNCGWTNRAIRERCRNFECGYDSNCGEFPWYDPMPPYDGLTV